MVHPCDVVMWKVPYQRIIFNIAASLLTFTSSESFTFTSHESLAHWWNRLHLHEQKHLHLHVHFHEVFTFTFTFAFAFTFTCTFI